MFKPRFACRRKAILEWLQHVFDQNVSESIRFCTTAKGAMENKAIRLSLQRLQDWNQLLIHWEASTTLVLGCLVRPTVSAASSTALVHQCDHRIRREI